MKKLSILSIKNRKGQISSLGPTILVLTIASIFLILGLVLLQSVRDTDIIKKAQTNSTLNETRSTVDELGVLLSGSSNQGFNSLSISSVTNASNGVVIPATNWSINNDTGRITYTGGGASEAINSFNRTNWNVSYSYAFGDQSYSGANKTVSGLGTFADFWQIIVLAVVIALVIGLLMTMIGGRRTR